MGVGTGVSGTAVGEPPLEEQAAINRTKSETAGQKKPARLIRDMDIKEIHSESLESWEVASYTYEQQPVADGTQAI